MEYLANSHFLSRVFLVFFTLCIFTNSRLRIFFAVLADRSAHLLANFRECLWTRSRLTIPLVVCLLAFLSGNDALRSSCSGRAPTRLLVPARDARAGFYRTGKRTNDNKALREEAERPSEESSQREAKDRRSQARAGGGLRAGEEVRRAAA